MPLTERRSILNDLVNQADDELLQYSREFSDPERLPAAGEKTKQTVSVHLLVWQDARLAEDRDDEPAGGEP